MNTTHLVSCPATFHTPLWQISEVLHGKFVYVVPFFKYFKFQLTVRSYLLFILPGARPIVGLASYTRKFRRESAKDSGQRKQTSQKRELERSHTRTHKGEAEGEERKGRRLPTEDASLRCSVRRRETRALSPSLANQQVAERTPAKIRSKIDGE